MSSLAQHTLPRVTDLSKAAVLVRTSRCKPLQRSSVARTLQNEHPTYGSGGIVKRRKNWEALCNSSAMLTSIQGFVSKEPLGERLENNFAKLFGRHLSLYEMRLAVVFVGTSFTLFFLVPKTVGILISGIMTLSS